MAALAHLTIACCTKKVYPDQLSLVTFIVSSYLLDIVAFILSFTKIDYYLYKITNLDGLIWSHSLIMALIWSTLLGLSILLFTRNITNSLIIFILAFSHWLIDLITWPLGCIWKGAPGLPLIWNNNKMIGLGLYNSLYLAAITELVSLILSIVLIMSIYKKRNSK